MNHTERCKRLALSVESLSQTELEELFKMIHRNNCEYTKNNNGIFVNLTWLSPDLLDQLEQYVVFCTRSGTELKKYESICDILNSKIHDTKQQSKTNIIDKKDKVILELKDDIDENDIDEKMISKVSSSLRFSLLKKKLSKISIQTVNYENDLKKEEHILCSEV